MLNPNLRIGKYQLGDLPRVELNVPQAMMIMAPQPFGVLIGGRGLGKSTILAKSKIDKASLMPRSSLVLAGETYQQMLTRTLPSTINGLEMLGWKQNIHFFVGRKAPAKLKWNVAYESPLNWDHAIHWYTGAVSRLISLDLPGDGRGVNSDGVDGDEAALFNEKRFINNVLATNRGNKDRFGHCPLHHSVRLYTSMPRTKLGRWLLKYRELAEQNPSKYFFLVASSEWNRHNLGDDWFRDMRASMTDDEYNAEILSLQPGNIEGGFYALLDEDVHTYVSFNNGYLLGLGHDYEKAKEAGCLADGDLQRSLPIDVAFDYGAKINVIHSEQEYDGESRGLKTMFVLSPDTIDVLVNKFCDYYHGQINKHVIYRYDHTAVYKDAVRTETFADVVIKTFRRRGWEVTPIYHGQAPSHHQRFKFWSTFLAGKDRRLPLFRMNRHNCKTMTISMQNAGAIEGRSGIEKDKRPEKQSGAIHEETTHPSDAADTLYFFKYARRLHEITGDYDV